MSAEIRGGSGIPADEGNAALTHSPFPFAPPPRGASGRAFLVGLSGMGMAPLAIFLSGSGWDVTGDDDHPQAGAVAALAAADVRLDHEGAIPEGTTVVVVSSAISPQHPRVREAEARALPVVRRGKMLADVLRNRRLVAVVGAHGKTTTTALLISALKASGRRIGYVLGALFAGDGVPPADAGAEDWVVAEIDESDGTIEEFAPEITVCTNIDWDHGDFYPTPADCSLAFERLFRRTRGAVLLSAECQQSARLAARFPRDRIHTFGYGADFALCGFRDGADGLRLDLGGLFGSREVHVPMHGFFNALNATSALAAVVLAGREIAPEPFAAFPGVRRRQSVVHRDARTTILEDYAHHPSEIRALLRSVRSRHGGRVVVVFQPHRYTRTAQFKADFAAALAGADLLVLLEVYAASEAPVAGGTSDALAAELVLLGSAPPVIRAAGIDAAVDEVEARLQVGDLIAIVGAGDVDEVGRRLAVRLAARPPQGAGTPSRADLLPQLRLRVGAGTVLRRDEPLAPKTTIGVGGPAEYYAEPEGEADLAALLRAARDCSLPVCVLGRGSNVLVPDEGVPGLVIRLSHPSWSACERLPDGRILTGPGLRLKQLCAVASAAGWTGFEFLEGIPGTIGGALRMNAGAMGGWMVDLVDELRLMTLGGELRRLPRSDLSFSYRACASLNDAIALAAILRPVGTATREAIHRTMDVYAARRKESQPRDPSAGCVFRNPQGDNAGRLIDQLGLKGRRRGGAEVSSVHANFIVNTGGATAADIIGLMREIRETALRRTGMVLEPEIILLGRRWEEVLS